MSAGFSGSLASSRWPLPMCSFSAMVLKLLLALLVPAVCRHLNQQLFPLCIFNVCSIEQILLSPRVSLPHPL